MGISSEQAGLITDYATPAAIAFTETSTNFTIVADGVEKGTWNKIAISDSSIERWRLSVDDDSIDIVLTNPSYAFKITGATSLTRNIIPITGTLREKLADIKLNILFLAQASSNSGSYSSYVCQFFSPGTSAPAPVVLHDSITGTNWTREATGRYRLNKVGGFPMELTYIAGFGNWDDSGNPYMPITSGGAIIGKYTMYARVNYIELEVKDANSSFVDLSSLIGDAGCLYLPEIRVYQS